MKFRNLHVRFGTQAEQVTVNESFPNLSYPLVQQSTSLNPAVADLTPEQHEAQNKAAIELAELHLKEEALARALIEDPEEYERLLRDGELSDDVAGADDSDE